MSNKDKIEGYKTLARYLGYKYFPYDKEIKKSFKGGYPRAFMFGWKKIDSNGNALFPIYKMHNNYLCRKHSDLPFNQYNWLMKVYKKAYIDAFSKDEKTNKKFMGLFNNAVVFTDQDHLRKKLLMFIEYLEKDG